jgi:hypothetical protein
MRAHQSKERGKARRRNRFSQSITTLDNMKTPPQIPSDTFSVHDIITVVGSSKHNGRLATVQKIGSWHLTVRFHDKNKGIYVNFANARIVETSASKTDKSSNWTSPPPHPSTQVNQANAKHYFTISFFLYSNTSMLPITRVRGINIFNTRRQSNVKPNGE